MTAMELQQWKQNFIRDQLVEIDDMEVLEKIKKYAKSIIPKKENPRPCIVHSQEEMIAKIRESEEDIKHGRIISCDDLEKEMEKWF